MLLYDGECGLCNRVVRLMLRWDRRSVLRFAPLQGPAAQAYLRAHGLPTDDFDTIVFVPDWARRDRRDFLVRTNGVMAGLRTLGSPTAAALAAFIGLFPAALRDAVYRVIGHWRYRIFGPWRPCPLPRPEWRTRFLT